MSLNVLQRAVALAAVALVSGLGALTLASSGREEIAQTTGPHPVPTADGGWYTALAGSRGAADGPQRTTCRKILTGRSLGVSHPVLPCGAKIYLAYGDSEVLTEVIDNKMTRSGRQFELTDALAQRLGVEGTQEIRWRFATR